MKDDKKDLFQMGEVTKALGITRRMLINYENLGLVMPTVKGEGQGFRFYSADNMVHIKLIRTLQNLGLSLPEIRSYFSNNVCLNDQIDRLVLLRNQLDQYIAQLRLRQLSDSILEVHQVTLPAMTAYFTEFHDADIEAKTKLLRNTFIEASKGYQLDPTNKIFIQVLMDNYEDGICVIPVTPGSSGENIKELPQTQVICIYYRGAYENFPEVNEILARYANSHEMTPSGFFRNVYMEGPPTHGTNKNAYVTQVSMPIKFVTGK